MARSTTTLIAALGTIALLAGGCGGGGGGNTSSNSYLPLEVGNTWNYTLTLDEELVPAQITNGLEFPYHETVTGIAKLQGTEYYVVETRRDAVDPYLEQVWQQFRRVTRDGVYARVAFIDPETQTVTYYYDLPILMLPPTSGETWTDPEATYVTFMTAATAEEITVPAGTFSCVRVDQEYDTLDENEETVHFAIHSWYARGVGVVRDETLQDDVLTSTLELNSYIIQ